jgi:AraC-like DNA-binding protein
MTAPVRHWRSAILGGVECARADYRRQSFARHFHDDYSMGVVTRGANLFHYRGRHVEAPAGTICLADPGEVHTGEAGEVGWSYWNLHVPVSAMRRLAEEAELPGSDVPALTAGMVDDPAAVRLCLTMFTALAEPGDAFEAEARAVEALTHLLRHHGSRRPPRLAAPAPALRVRDYLEAHWHEPVRLDHLEAVSGLGRWQLLRGFRTAYGLPPYAYLMQLRLRAAKDMLLAGLGIAETAAATGFADQAHLTRAFKRVYGLTPAVMRRQ